MNKMTPEIALANLDLAASMCKGDRKDHQGLIESVQVIQALIESSKVVVPQALKPE